MPLQQFTSPLLINLLHLYILYKWPELKIKKKEVKRFFSYITWLNKTKFKDKCKFQNAEARKE